MRRKMEIAWEQQRLFIAATIQHPMPNLAIPLVFTIRNPAMEAEEDDPGWSTSETFGSQFTT